MELFDSFAIYEVLARNMLTFNPSFIQIILPCVANLTCFSLLDNPYKAHAFSETFSKY